MNSNVFSGQTEQWYSLVMTGYIVTAATVSVGLTAVMTTEVM